MEESNQQQKFRAKMEKDFWPTEGGGASERRNADALEFIAFQSGQINRKLDRLIDAIEKLAAVST